MRSSRVDQCHCAGLHFGLISAANCDGTGALSILLPTCALCGDCRIRHDVPPTWRIQLPAVEVFGMHIAAQQLLIAAALGIFLGWKMLLFLAILCEYQCM